MMLGFLEVSANTASTRLTTARTSVQRGSTTDILVRIDSSSRIRGGQFNLGLNNSHFSIVSVNGASGFTVSSSGNFHLAYRIEAGYSVASGSPIASVRVRANNNAPIGATTRLTVSNVGVTLVGVDDTISGGSRSINLTVAETPPPPPTLDSNNFLKSLTSPVVDIDFDRNTTEYNLEVPNDVTSLDLKAEAEENTSSVEIIGDEDFTTGENHVKVEVTAENGAKRTYHLYVTRAKSDNNLLSSLTISGYEIDFDKNTFSYQIDVPDETTTRLDIAYVVDDETASVEIIGNEDLQVGRNIIRIIVTAENGDEQTYTLVVNISGDIAVVHEEGINLVIVILSTILGLVIVGQIYLIYKWKKEDELKKL